MAYTARAGERLRQRSGVGKIANDGLGAGFGQRLQTAGVAAHRTDGLTGGEQMADHNGSRIACRACDNK